ncbi:MAG: D-glycerate dehydrogenase [Pseudomonadota bacterium]
MSAKRPKVVVTRKLPDAVETRMRELFQTDLNLEDTPFTAQQLEEAVATADVLVPSVSDRITDELIAKAGPQLKLIAHFGNGTDNIDIAAANKKGITVTNTPRVLTDDTADMIMAMMLAVPRRLVEGARIMDGPDGWPGWSPTWMLGKRVTGKRLGIVGMGRIGAAVAQRAKAFGMAIHYHNRKRVHDALEEQLEATYWDSLDQMLARMDIISVNCPFTPATYHLLSERRLKLVQAGAYIVNAARGEIIDENALLDQLENGALAGAALDVFENEPAVNDRMRALSQSGKLLILPHMGSATVEGRMEMGDKVIINIRTFFDGHRPPDRVLPNKD